MTERVPPPLPNMAHTAAVARSLARAGLEGSGRWLGRLRAPGVLPWTAAWGATALVFLWARTLEGRYLLAAAGALVLTLWVVAQVARATPEGSSRFRRRVPVWALAALACLVLATIGAAWTEQRLSAIASDWDRLVTEREQQLTQELHRRMQSVIDAGVRASSLAGKTFDTRDAFGRLAEVRAQTGVAAVAVFDEHRELVAWAGEHRGTLPGQLHSSASTVAYVERPLFSYLYFLSPVEGRAGWRAVSAVLLQTGLPFGQRAPLSLADAFAAELGARPVFAAGAGEDAAWVLTHDGEAVIHGRFEPISQAERRGVVGDAGRRFATVLGTLSLVLLGVGWHRGERWRRRRASAVPLAVSAVILPIAPLGAVFGIERVFSPAQFLVPFPIDLTLGTLLVVLLPLAALASTRRADVVPGRREAAAIPLGALAVALGFATGLRLMIAWSEPPLFQNAALLWGAFFPATTLLLTIVAALALPTLRDRREGGIRPAPLVAGAGVSVLLGFVVVANWEMTLAVPAWLPALWAAPFLLMALGLARYRGRASLLARWLAAGWLAGSAVIPHLWVTQMGERFAAAERDLRTLGAEPDPWLDYLLRIFATEVRQRAERGEAGEELLYRSWIASNMAGEGYPATITLWGPADEPLAALSLGGGAPLDRRSAAQSPNVFIAPIRNRARETGQPVVEAVLDLPDINHVLAVPLPENRLVSVLVPPRRSLDRVTVLAPFLQSQTSPTDIQLTLVPVARVPGPVSEEITWRPSEIGWRSEARVRYPDGDYHAHLELRTPSMIVRLARGVLLLALGLGGLVVLWFAGRAARGDLPAPAGGWGGWLGGFRARVTLALFAFFLIPTALFGWVAYRALAGEVTRAARAVAERSVGQAVAAFPDQESNLRLLASRIGEEVLRYHRGELAEASSAEALALGLYDAWMPVPVYLTFQSGEETAVVETRELIREPYLVAYRRLPAAGTLAVPVSLRAGDAAVRQQELAHLVLFAALMGGLLSLALSVAVGRALAEPIGQLRRAAAAVGAGRLGVRLPEHRADEFGELFTSFNHMARRLRRARARELRTARVLAWGEMARQIAHEIKNPLTPIKLSVQHLRRAYRDRRPDFEQILESNVEQVLTEIDRLSDVARAFSRYGSPGGPAGPLEDVDVGAVVHEVLALYRAGDSDIRYIGETPDHLPRARARASELKEVLLNLIENARAAVDGDGRVMVSASATPQSIELAVADNGHGIEPELLTKIFEPHFSTRSSGTGLGLAIVRRLVESWGGDVSVESGKGRGTTVRVRLKQAGS